MLEGLASVAHVDIVLALEDAQDLPGAHALLPIGVGYDRLLVVTTPPRGQLRKAVLWALSDEPWLYSSLGHAVATREIEAWVGDRYDLAWYARADAFHFVGPRVRSGRTIVDFADVESAKIRRRVNARVDRRLVRTLLYRDSKRWAMAERAVASSADNVAVCSEIEAALLGGAPAMIIPNGGREPPSGYHRMPDRRTMVFVGALDYLPNIDALHFMVDEVLPLVTRAVPDARLVVIGRSPGAAVRALATTSGVDVVGEVDDVAEFLAIAAVAVVPVRYGGGTRVKLVEAASHLVPVVSTSVGCEGLGLRPGSDLLVADDAGTFAAACVAMLVDEDRARGVARAARAWFERGFGWRQVSELVASAVQT